MSRLMLLSALLLLAALASPAVGEPRGKCTVGDTYLYDCYYCGVYYYCGASLVPQQLACPSNTCWDQTQSLCVSDRTACSTPCVQ